MFLEIFRAVVVGEFFAGLDASAGSDEHASARSDRFAVGAARVIDVSREIRRNIAVDRETFFDFKIIFTLVSERVRGTDRFANVFDDARSLRDV